MFAFISAFFAKKAEVVSSFFVENGDIPENAEWLDNNTLPSCIRVDRFYEVITRSSLEGEAPRGYMYLVRDKQRTDQEYYIKSLLQLPINFQVRRIASATQCYTFV